MDRPANRNWAQPNHRSLPPSSRRLCNMNHPPPAMASGSTAGPTNGRPPPAAGTRSAGFQPATTQAAEGPGNTQEAPIAMPTAPPVHTPTKTRNGGNRRTRWRPSPVPERRSKPANPPERVSGSVCREPDKELVHGVEIGAAPLSTDCDGGMSQGLITVKRVVTDLV